MVLRSATTGTVGKRSCNARTARSPSARISGVPASSQSTPACTAIAATRIASSIEVRSSETWTCGRRSSSRRDRRLCSTFIGRPSSETLPSEVYDLCHDSTAAISYRVEDGQAKPFVYASFALEPVQRLAGHGIAQGTRECVPVLGSEVVRVHGGGLPAIHSAAAVFDSRPHEAVPARDVIGQGPAHGLHGQLVRPGQVDEDGDDGGGVEEPGDQR